MDTYDTVNPQEEMAKVIRLHKTEVLLPKITEGDRFFETFSINRGFNFHTFDDHDKAVEWLKT